MQILSFLIMIRYVLLFLFSISISLGCFQVPYLFAGDTPIFSAQSFEDMGVVLSSAVKREYTSGEGILVRGKVINKKSYVLFFLKHKVSGETFSDLVPVDADGTFRIAFSLPNTTGEYLFVIASGNSFSSDHPEILKIVPRTSTPAFGGGIALQPPKIVYGNAAYLDFGGNISLDMLIMQGKTKMLTSGDILTFTRLPLQKGSARVFVSGKDANRNEYSWMGNVFIDRTRQLTGEGIVSLVPQEKRMLMQFRIPLGTQVQSKYYLTLPSGEVQEYQFSKQYIATDGYLKQDIWIQESFPLSLTGVHKIETITHEGFAYFNLPISLERFWSIVPFMSYEQKTIISTKTEIVSKYILGRINILRKTLSKNTLQMDQKLMQLAQAKAENMAKNAYVGHITPDGKNISQFAVSLGINQLGTLGENVAGGNVSHLALQDGLEESGSHRHSMLDTRWRYIGIGYAVRDKKAYLVHVFGE